jgi:hypothetical protein
MKLSGMTMNFPELDTVWLLKLHIIPYIAGCYSLLQLHSRKVSYTVTETLIHLTSGYRSYSSVVAS